MTELVREYGPNGWQTGAPEGGGLQPEQTEYISLDITVPGDSSNVFVPFALGPSTGYEVLDLSDPTSPVALVAADYDVSVTVGWGAATAPGRATLEVDLDAADFSWYVRQDNDLSTTLATNSAASLTVFIPEG